MKFSIKIALSLLLIICSLSTSFSQDDPIKNDTTKTDKKKKKDLPLEPGRTFEFDLNEGSWMALDVSPDGNTIVFDFLGDLYTIAISGGDATQITEGMQFDSQPRFSPDGKKVIYISDESGGENVWTYDFNSKEKKQITKGNTNSYQSPEWSPDGKYMVASKQSGRNLNKIWLYHVEGGSGVALVKEPNNLRMIEAAFGSDDRYIWFSRRTGNWTYNAPMPQYQMATYDRETGEIITQASRYGSSFRPTPSSDGKWLAFFCYLFVFVFVVVFFVVFAVIFPFVFSCCCVFVICSYCCCLLRCCCCCCHLVVLFVVFVVVAVV